MNILKNHVSVFSLVGLFKAWICPSFRTTDDVLINFFTHFGNCGPHLSNLSVLQNILQHFLLSSLITFVANVLHHLYSITFARVEFLCKFLNACSLFPIFLHQHCTSFMNHSYAPLSKCYLLYYCSVITVSFNLLTLPEVFRALVDHSRGKESELGSQWDQKSHNRHQNFALFSG